MSAVRPLSDSGLLEIWERCGAKPPVERALSLLEHGFPGMTHTEIETLDIRTRDRMLLDLRAASMGADLEGRLQCPHCGEWLEFSLETDDLRARLARDLPPLDYASSCGSFDIRLQAVNSRDLSFAARGDNLEDARRLLLDRLVTISDGEGSSVPTETLSTEILNEAMERLEALQSECEVRLNFVCAACEAPHARRFDVGAFFWLEISQLARRLIDEVHELAWAYGWPEGEILAMSARRRQAYLDRIWQ